MIKSCGVMEWSPTRSVYEAFSAALMKGVIAYVTPAVAV